ncbi:hypothetical protein NDU88_007686 [Pleurodeles waltl]|uniref:Uncharacterized protein n=1 Tax=Pleurodeles waltl TaxID=8319 RepID=A0AAV7VTA6_PLEWA|nr:hypothetical protein NDU88_007686 [Pleurodeles waltl]
MQPLKQAISGLPGRSPQTLLPLDHPGEPWPVVRRSKTGGLGDALPTAEREPRPSGLLRRRASSLVSAIAGTAEGRAPSRLDEVVVGDQEVHIPSPEGHKGLCEQRLSSYETAPQLHRSGRGLCGLYDIRCM